MATIFTLPDSRKVSYQINGAASGFPLIWIHGTPGAYPVLPSLASLCTQKNIKLISYSRAGYGDSTRLKGRRVVDGVKDIEALMQHLDIKKCFVAGWSGGGPYALASAARLDGCVAALCIAGCAPFDVDDLDFLEGQGQDNIDEFHAAMEGEDAVRAFCSAQRDGMLNADAAAITEQMSSILPDVDKAAILKNDEMGQNLTETFHEALKHGVDGWVDDNLEFIQPWGFDVKDVRVPVLLYQGSEDKMVPYGHGKWLAEHLPKDKVRANLQQGHGHISIFVDQAEMLLDELLKIGTG